MGCGPSSQRRRSVVLTSVVEEHTAETIETKKDSNTLTRVNQYKIERVLGKGAFGEVYLALDQNHETVAVKVMDKGELRKKSKQLGKPAMKRPGAKPAADAGPSVSEQILREIATMKRVQHPNCVRLFEVIDDALGDRMFLIMEFLDGGEVLTKKNLPEGADSLAEEHALEIFRDLLDGLEYLHGNGILHRDIKPENMVYAERPNFKIPYWQSQSRARAE